MLLCLSVFELHTFLLYFDFTSLCIYCCWIQLFNILYPLLLVLSNIILSVTVLPFSVTLANRSPPLHVSVTLEPVELVGLGSPLLHRNRRAQRRRSPVKLYQKPAHPGAQCRSCSGSYKYDYTVCLILSSSPLWIFLYSCASVWSSALHCRTLFCPNF